MKRRRSVSVFGMSFLDVMFCGFGSVVLLVMLLNGQAIAQRERVHEDLRGEVNRLERELLAAERQAGLSGAALERARRALDEARDARGSAQTQAARARDERARVEAESLARRDSVQRLQGELKRLDADRRGLAEQAAAAEADAAGDDVRRFRGDGDRQYLTGLRMGGERILILVDASASMLDQTIVNVVRRRNMGEAARRAAPKWRRAVATVEWLLSQLPRRAAVQVYTFDTEARPLIDAQRGRWIDTGDGASLDALAAALADVAPAGGTSLHAAFAAIASFAPAPDNVMLITDGLPTRGASPPAGATVTPEERLRHFDSAVRGLGTKVPVNVILLPMEGDPLAASAFWRLASATRGAFIAPARDWP